MLTPVRNHDSPAKLSAAPGQVRIIAGAWRGRKLSVANLPGLRPTPDRVRETVFNWLQPVIAGSRCLDLFAGSGALGLEAASRGAAEVWLIERDATALTVLRDNARKLAADTLRIEAGDALQFLRQAPPARFDIVFLDPPYDSGLLQPALDLLLAGGWLTAGAYLYTEWPAEHPPPRPDPPWRLARAGRVHYALYRPGAGSG